MDSAFVQCAHCDSATPPEPQGGGAYFCSCCGKITIDRPEPVAKENARSASRRR
jgi:hypothetical protein